MPEPKDLVAIIKANPKCVAVIDNDSWELFKDDPPPADFEKWNFEQQDKWRDGQKLASSDDQLVRLGDGGYGSGNCYGGDILQALAAIVGIRVESV